MKRPKKKKCRPEISAKQLRQWPKLEDSLGRMSGQLQITVQDAKTGKLVESRVIDNLVMTNLRTQESRLFVGEWSPTAGDPTTNRRYIRELRIGTNGTEPTVDDILITAPVTIAPLVASYPAVGQVTLSGTLGANQGNGVTYREAGLVFSSPSGLATRVIFAPMEKSALWVWQFAWTLAFN